MRIQILKLILCVASAALASCAAYPNLHGKVTTNATYDPITNDATVTAGGEVDFLKRHNASGK